MTSAIIKLVSTKSEDIDSIAKQICEIAKTSSIKSRGPIPLPTHRISQTVRKSPCGSGSHTYEKWEMRIHKRLIIIEGDESALRQVMRLKVPDTVQIEIGLAG
ncbi:MAG: 30S ribosomal protein S10 [Candidatus Marsarchaeota archaeon]|nr:30S ribosomal protein S10 [Candidatus Marsarchaeota archaeon]MCL5419216.1 30S ribosomal protein S10 [Candidatus Marsarchaeota archaeon]